MVDRNPVPSRPALEAAEAFIATSRGGHPNPLNVDIWLRAPESWDVHIAFAAYIDQHAGAVEWDAHTRGQGSGYMGSGGDGPVYRSCSLCRGIEPTDGAAVEFIKTAIGHRPECPRARGGTAAR